jgi:1-acyl-sn-glycerol-3-phosphate acyltransferase
MSAPLLRALRTTGFVGITAGMLPLYMAREAMSSGAAAKDTVRDRWTGRWSRALLDLFGVERTFVGARPASSSRPSRGRLVVANHRSTIDVALLLEAFGGHVISRADLSKWPVVGLAARRTGTIFVDRSSKTSGARALREVAAVLEAGGTVSVFPEGTTFPDDDVRPFHRGVFSAGARGHADVVPVGIAYEEGSAAIFFEETFLEHLSRMSGAPTTRVAIAIGDPISTVGTKPDAVALAARVAVQSLVRVARAALHGEHETR